MCRYFQGGCSSPGDHILTAASLAEASLATAGLSPVDTSALHAMWDKRPDLVTMHYAQHPHTARMAAQAESQYESLCMPLKACSTHPKIDGQSYT